MNSSDNIVFEKLPDALLPWYEKNARILPWRENHDPYRIWVSEIMLQQTRVETVIPYYKRFLCVLPDIASLANSDETQLLKLWEGLGYYTRVRNLQKAARIIVEHFQGTFPRQFDDIRNLPGIGDYTAGAIASIAFEQPEPAVDGNVLRVISRILESREDIRNPKFKKTVAERLKQNYPITQRGNFTQSLMELGATICLPNGTPDCKHCPLNSFCQSFIHGTTQDIPVKIQKNSRRLERKTLLILRCNEKIALQKRPLEGLLSGLWEPPNLEGVLTEKEIREFLEKNGILFHSLWKGPDAKHTFSHVEWEMNSFFAECTTESDCFSWFSKAELEQKIALPSAFKAYRKKLFP